MPRTRSDAIDRARLHEARAQRRPPGHFSIDRQRQLGRDGSPVKVPFGTLLRFPPRGWLRMGVRSGCPVQRHPALPRTRPCVGALRAEALPALGALDRGPRLGLALALALALRHATRAAVVN